MPGDGRCEKVIAAELPEFARAATAVRPYNDDDLAHRVIYVEASRGCPFKCEFCLSSLDVPVRNAPLDAFLAAMQSLLDRGVRQFKFVDRTFNLNLNIGRSILQFFLDRMRPGLFLHFEMIPDRLPELAAKADRAVPAGRAAVRGRHPDLQRKCRSCISRRQDNGEGRGEPALPASETGVHVHADLIVGLPGETIESFAAGFDRLVALRPQEIQVGMLKRLRGTPIVRHDAEWDMVYSPHPPYEVLQTKLIDFATMHRLRRFARYWDLIANSGRFVHALPVLLEGRLAVRDVHGAQRLAVGHDPRRRTASLCAPVRVGDAICERKTARWTPIASRPHSCRTISAMAAPTCRRS